MGTDLIELDDRGRAPLRQFGGDPHRRYLVEADVDGVIHLYPAAIMSELELAMWRNRPADAVRIDGSLAHPDELVEMTEDDL